MTAQDAIRLFTKTLENLEKWMDKAGEPPIAGASTVTAYSLHSPTYRPAQGRRSSAC